MKHISSIYLILFLISTIAGLLPAQTYWQESNGIYIGRPRVFIAWEKGFIIVGSDLGAFKTITDGDYWQETELNKTVECFTTDTSGNIYAGTSSGGVFFSSDDGDKWIERNDSLPAGRVIGITACPNGDAYAILSEGIYKLTAQTPNWILVDTTMINKNIVNICSNSEGYLFAGVQSGTTYISTNEGLTWSPTDSVIQNGYLFSQFVDRNDIIYKSLSGIGTLRSTDSGFHWTTVNNNVLVSFSETSSDTLYAISSFDGFSEYGVYKSSDNGLSWEISSGTPNSQLAALGALNNGVVLTSGLNGEIYRSLDYGESFHTKRTRPNTINAIIIGKNKNIFAGSFALGIYKSPDAGNSWTQVDNGSIEGGLNAMVFSPNQDIFVAAQGGIYKSTDQGETWIECNIGLIKKWTQDITVNSRGDLFAATFGNGVVRSTDNGLNWQTCNEGLADTNIMKIVVGKDNYLFAGCSVEGVYRSTNNGNTWHFMENGPYKYTSVRGLSADTAGHVCAISDKLYYSSDQGDNWAISNFSFDDTLWEIAFDTKGHLFVSTYFSSVFRSDDYGVSWNEFSNGLPSNINVSSFAGAEDGNVFAGTINGVYRTINPVTSIEEKNLHTELSFELLQNYPNPFNTSTTISYSISKESKVKVIVFDVLGREIKTLLEKDLQPGHYEINFDASDVTSGIYFYRVQSDLNVNTKKMILLK